MDRDGSVCVKQFSPHLYFAIFTLASIYGYIDAKKVLKNFQFLCYCSFINRKKRFKKSVFEKENLFSVERSWSRLTCQSI